MPKGWGNVFKILTVEAMGGPDPPLGRGYGRSRPPPPRSRLWEVQTPPPLAESKVIFDLTTRHSNSE
jgi:hypothetical protein